MDYTQRGLFVPKRAAQLGAKQVDPVFHQGQYDFMTTSGPDYNQYPMQMFSRNIATLDECLIVLVATKHMMTEELRAQMRSTYTGNDAHIKTKLAEQSVRCDSFYSFQYVPTTLRTLWQGLEAVDVATGRISYPMADPASTKVQGPVKHSFPVRALPNASTPITTL